MELAVNGVSPAVTVVDVPQLPGPGLFRGWPKQIPVAAAEALFLAEGREGRMVAPAGNLSEMVQVHDKAAKALLVPRDFDLDFALRGVRFAGNHEGEVQLQAKCRLLDRERHPLLAALGQEAWSPESFETALARRLTAALGPLLGKVISHVSYEAGATAAVLNDILEPFHEMEAVTDALRRDAGLALSARLYARHTTCAVLDAAAARETETAREDEERRREIATARKDAARQYTLESMGRERELTALAHQIRMRQAVTEAEEKEKLTRRRGEHQASLIEQDRRVKTAEAELAELAVTQGWVKVNLETARAEEVRAAAERARAEADKVMAEKAKVAAETDTERAKADRERAETGLLIKRAQALEHEQRVYEGLNLGLKSIEERLAAFEKALATPREEDLALLTTWRAYERVAKDRGELSVARLSTGHRLPTGMMLELETRVNQDAYVYVVLKASGGRWQVIVPDVEGIQGAHVGMGGVNRLKAGEVRAWPGGNRHVPSLPFWMLDRQAGYERLLVIASRQELDIQGIVSQGIERWQRGIPAPRTRGFVAPRADDWVADRTRPRPGLGQTPSYQSVFTALSAPDIVVDEMVIEHY